MNRSKRNWLNLCAVLGLAINPVWAANTTVGAVVDDSIITAKVKAALIENQTTKARQIDVETRGGVVQLNGFVDTANARMAAEGVAKGVTGVKSVANNLEVRAGGRSTGDVIDDATITARVKSALVADARTRAYQVEVKTYKGVVSLGGFVASDAERQAAQTLATNVQGVTRVDNGIMVGKRQSK